MKRPIATDNNVMKLMGLMDDGSKFEEIRGKICDFCLAKLPIPQDVTMYLDAVRHVQMLVLAGLVHLRNEYSAEFGAIRHHLADNHKTEEFLFRWVIACNESGLDQNRIRLHPRRNLLRTSVPDIRHQDGDEDDISTTTDSTDQSQSAETDSPQVRLTPDLPQTLQLQTAAQSTTSVSPSQTESEIEHKRSIDQVEESGYEDQNRPRKIVRSVMPTEPFPIQEPDIQPPTIAPPDWRTVILHFKVMDIESDNPRVKAARVPLRKFLHGPQSVTADSNPCKLKLKDLNEHVRGSVMGQTLNLDNVYARLADDSATPAPLDDGELDVILMKWEILRSTPSRFEEIIVELWRSIETFSEVRV